MRAYLRGHTVSLVDPTFPYSAAISKGLTASASQYYAMKFVKV